MVHGGATISIRQSVLRRFNPLVYVKIFIVMVTRISYRMDFGWTMEKTHQIPDEAKWSRRIQRVPSSIQNPSSY